MLVSFILPVILSFSFLYNGTISGNISNNELASEVFGSSSFDSKNCNYSLITLQENNLISGVVFGKNIDANTIEINFKGTKYTENLNENEYFMVPFPNFENVDDLTDFYNFFEGKESLDLKIKFYYKDGNQCTNMKFSY